jgi:SAM-dependent methyltransferase
VGASGGSGGRGVVEVRGVWADVADGGLREKVPAARLVWASRVVHHLPDQRAGLAALAGLLTPGGCLAVAVGGLALRCLPWDLGIGEPGLADRLTARRDAWFAGMRASMPGATRMPHGWNRALSEIGLVGVTSFSYLVDRPAPLAEPARASVEDWLRWMANTTDVLDSADADTVRRLLDPADPAYIRTRDDTFVLKATTVHLAWSR